MAVDSTGNIYVADSSNNTIRKMTTAGEVMTLAGLAGSLGSADGIGDAARFANPLGVAVDSAGNVYVADSGNYTIRRGFVANGEPVIATSKPYLGFNNNRFGFNVTGPAGQVIVFDASSDLKTWFPIWTNAIGTGALSFGDTQNSVSANRYYRVHTP